MAGMTNQVRDQLQVFLSRLTLKQKLLIFTGFAIALAILMVMLVWTTRPNYEVLFSNLSQKDAGKILEKLKEKKIEYRLENGGSTILVPTDKVYELRLNFAQEGLPESSGVGYEIFDKTNLGMTDFIQKVNYRRALEGELTRTIEQIEAVEKARVHIVIPKESLFKEDQKQTTASVILKLRGSSLPPKATVQGIAHLIASSVEGLQPENITIVDTRGRILSDHQDPGDMVTLSSTQLEFAKQVESYLSQKAQSMLDQVIGPGNAVVRVSADLNFTRVEKSIEQYDPDNTAVRSEEIQEESNPISPPDGATATGNLPAAKRSSTVTNYEINKTVQRVVEGVGNIQRLSVAVLINNKKQVVTKNDGTKEVKYIPRSPEELDQLGNLVRTAVGFQPERGDQFSVVNVDFSLPTLEDELLEMDKPNLWDNWYDLIEKIFLFLAIISSMLIMRSLFSHVKKRNEEIKEQIMALQQGMQSGQLALPPHERQQLSEGKEENQIIESSDFFKLLPASDPLNEKLRGYITENPEEAAKLIKVWLLEEKEE